MKTIKYTGETNKYLTNGKIYQAHEWGWDWDDNYFVLIRDNDNKNHILTENYTIIEKEGEKMENLKEMLKKEILKSGGHILLETVNGFEYSMVLFIELTYLVEVDGDDFQTSQIANGFKSEPIAHWLPIA